VCEETLSDTEFEKLLSTCDTKEVEDDADGKRDKSDRDADGKGDECNRSYKEFLLKRDFFSERSEQQSDHSDVADEQDDILPSQGRCTKGIDIGVFK